MSVIDIDSTYDQLKSSRLRHQLAEHPLMTRQSLAELALRMDPQYVRFHEGDRRVSTYMGEMLQTDPTRQRLRNAIDNLHTAKAFVQILNVRSDPTYRALVDDLVDEIVPRLPRRDRQLRNRDAAVFMASPWSVTPFHLDHEQNFLCHIRGAKTFYVWDHRDRSVVSERALEIFYREGSLREVLYQASMQPKAQPIELAPGDCVYMPMGSPHAATTGSEVTVTFSVLMNTQSAFDLVEIYRVNYVLRRLGLSPIPVGISHARDSLKRRALGAIRRLSTLARARGRERRLQWY